MKTVIRSARHSPFTPFGPLFRVLLSSSCRVDSMRSVVMMEEVRRNRAIQKIDSMGMMPFPMTLGFITESGPGVEKKGCPIRRRKPSPPIPAFSPTRRLPRSRGSASRRGRWRFRTGDSDSASPPLPSTVRFPAPAGRGQSGASLSCRREKETSRCGRRESRRTGGSPRSLFGRCRP